MIVQDGEALATLEFDAAGMSATGLVDAESGTVPLAPLSPTITKPNRCATEPGILSYVYCSIVVAIQLSSPR
jgi:hypothetical protein